MFWIYNFISDFVSYEFYFASAVLWITFSEAVFKASSPAFVAVSINCFPYLLDKFLANDKNPYPLKVQSQV